MTPVRVMIVEDSRAVREFLEHVIGRDPRLVVVSSVDSAESALRALPGAAPDVISMDVHLPGMDGLEATQRIMSERPTPIVVVSASVDSRDQRLAISALRAGALAVVEKPVGVTHAGHEAAATDLCTQLVIMSQVRVIRQRFNGARRPAAGDRTPAPRPDTLPTRPFSLVGIVASTGGPRVLETILGGLPADFPLPILLVQHLTPSFMGGFVEWLGGQCALRVEEARAGEFPRAGVVHVAPADRHLRLEAGRIALDGGPEVALQNRSGTAMLSSLARAAGRRAIGVVLTGMGDDGAEGLLRIREHGGHTIAQDETSSAVYGMPASAVRIGAACESLPPLEVVSRLLSLAAVREEAA